MAVFVLLRRESYFDSVLLMRISQALQELPGAEDAVAVMGTPHNRELLAGQGFGGPILASAGPNDLVIAVRGEGVTAERAEAEFEKLLRAQRPAAAADSRPTSLAAALDAHPEANVVLISVPGEYAAREARRALAAGRHVMLFSDNVSLSDEVVLKRDAVARGLLLMGPDCGTAILNGLPLGFANAVRRGPIGLVAAAGTGIQEVSSLIHRMGSGVSQAIGTGGRDMSDDVGGRMALFGIEALAADPATRVICVVSKSPSPAVAARVVTALAATGKPCAVHFVGAPVATAPGVVGADSLAGLAMQACRLAGVAGIDPVVTPPAATRVANLAARLASGARLCGLFCGGTTGQEALAVLTHAGLEVRSNLHKKGALRLEGPALVRGTASAAGHVLLDLGDDVFTRGRPHPMIEPVLRNERLQVEMKEPSVSVLLFDCVLGSGAHADPSGVLVEGVTAARAISPGRSLLVIASVTGTPEDPQDWRSQVQKLVDAGVVVEPHNYAAAALAAAVLATGAGRAEREEGRP
jgi:FdrA protein